MYVQLNLFLLIKFYHQIPYDSFEYWVIYSNDEEKLKEAKEKCEYPPRLQILYTRMDPSINLDYRFHVEKKENEKSEVVAIFPLMKKAKGNLM